MNDNTHIDELPPLSDEAIARIETAVFSEIASERAPDRTAATRRRSRRRAWVTGLGVAAAFAVGVLVTPPVMGLLGAGSGASTADGWGIMSDGGGSSVNSAPESAPESAPQSLDSASESRDTSGGVAQIAPETNREIIATAQATLKVKDIAKAADAVAALAEEHGGFVESTNIGKSVAVDDASMPAPPADSGYGWVSIRVPSADLTTVMDELEKSGEVLSSSISKQDVTSTAIDLRARVEATRASVQRLTELMSQSGSVSELIEAEVALTDRQAQLESYEQQLASLEDQVAMSTLQVELTKAAAPTTADPAGFGDGLLAGWNGLIVSLNALVVAIGFILPWVAILAVVVLVIWLIRRARRNARLRLEAPSEN